MPRPLPPNQLESLDQSCIGILVTLWKTSRVNHCPIFLSSSTIFPIHCIFFSQTMFEILCFFSSLLCTLSILLLIQLFFHSIFNDYLFESAMEAPPPSRSKKQVFKNFFSSNSPSWFSITDEKKGFHICSPIHAKLEYMKKSTLRCNHCRKVSSISASDGSEHEGEDQAQAAQTAPEAEIADSPQVFSWK